MRKRAKELGPLEVERLSLPGVRAIGSVARLALQITANGARSRGAHLHHGGSEDREALQQLGAALRKTLGAADRMSPWVSQAVAAQLHQAYMACDDEPRSLRHPQVPEDLKRTAEIWMALSRSAEKTLKKVGPVVARTGALIDDARRAWKANTGKTPPPRQLNHDTDFAKFFEDLPNKPSISAHLSRACDAWYEATKDSNSLHDPPDAL